jgi:hypothetical protein
VESKRVAFIKIRLSGTQVAVVGWMGDDEQRILLNYILILGMSSRDVLYNLLSIVVIIVCT